MSHFTQYKRDAASPEDRNLGDEWADWDGQGGEASHVGKGMFLITAGIVLVALIVGLAAAAYLVAPRLAQWYAPLPTLFFAAVAACAAITLLWFVQIVVAALTERNVFLKGWGLTLFDLVFGRAFRLAQLLGISRDHMGHSFVKVSNAIARARKVRGREERVLVLLPRCLTPEQIKEINSYKERYGIFVHTVSGGELARKKVRELKPTAVIGVACERDLVSGIRDVGTKLSVIGLPNERPAGPCKDTRVDLAQLRAAIEFYVGAKASR